MNNLTKKTDSVITPDSSEKTLSATPRADMIAKGVATGVAVTTIVHTGKGVISAMSRNPLIMFGMGVLVGFFAHKYRKEIVSVSHKAVEESRDFMLRQREHLEDLIAESREEADLPRKLH